MSAIRGPKARLVRQWQHPEPCLWGRIQHTASIGPRAGGKTPAGRLGPFRTDGPRLVLVRQP